MTGEMKRRKEFIKRRERRLQEEEKDGGIKDGNKGRMKGGMERKEEEGGAAHVRVNLELNSFKSHFYAPHRTS